MNNSRNNSIKAVAYLRTSSASNVGADKDSEKRQRHAIQSFARRSGYIIVDEFYDAAVSGSDPVETRPGFSDLLDRIEGNGVRVVLVEDSSRLARSVLVQELAILALQTRAVRVLASNGDDLTETDDEMKVAMRQIGAAFAQLEKTRLVKKLHAARQRRRATGIKVEGRKALAELQPELVTLAKRLHRRNRKSGERRSLRAIADELALLGHTSTSGKSLSPSVVKRLLET